jgi:(p)ppGpp synthase/HD superfamily hydrolase
VPGGRTHQVASVALTRTAPSLGTVGFTVPDAHLLALEAHAGQVDKQGRDYYLAHLRPVAETLRPYGPAAEMAGLLHDIVEDTREHPAPARRYDLDRLRALGVPEIVVEAIDAVTLRPGEPYMSGLIRRAAAHPLGRLVKLADNSHNLAANAALAEIDPAKARSLREGRYRPARRILLAAEAADRLHGRRILV